jgi:hypothetical protein
MVVGELVALPNAWPVNTAERKAMEIAAANIGCEVFLEAGTYYVNNPPDGINNRTTRPWQFFLPSIDKWVAVAKENRKLTPEQTKAAYAEAARIRNEFWNSMSAEGEKVQHATEDDLKEFLEPGPDALFGDDKK